MNDPNVKKQDGDLRRRLRELMAVPERERTDEQWDELAAIEVRLAPGNRLDSGPRAEGTAPPSSGRQPNQAQAPSPRPHGRRPKKPRR